MHLGLIGQSLQHSFSPAFFAERFAEWGLSATHSYRAFELPSIQEFPKLLESQKLSGLNVTIPYKESVIPYLDQLDPIAAAIGAVNTIAIKKDGQTKGYNTDVIGLRISIDRLCAGERPQRALVIGDGGAAKAVRWVLEEWGIPYFTVSRRGPLTFDHLTAETLAESDLLIQATPLGTYPNVDDCPPIPFHALGQQHRLLDLVYNPSETLFLRMGRKRGAIAMNGRLMLEEQALASWNIWQNRF